VGTFAVKTWAFLACTGTSLLLKSYLDYTDIGITLPLHPTEPQAANLVFEDQVPPTWYQGSWEENRGVKGALGLRSWLHKMEYISPEGLRQDGRRPQELRQLKCEIGFLPKADGSAVFEMGSTKVLAAVSGPKAGGRPTGLIASGTIKCEVAIAAFCVPGERGRRRTWRDRRIHDLTSAVQATLEQTVLLELLPRSEIGVFVQVLQADGGERAACINAAMLAIANAGIPVRDMVAACSVGFLESTPLLDLNLTEVQGQPPQTMVAAYPNLDKVAFLESHGGNMQLDSLEEMCDLALEGSKAVSQFMRSCLLAHTTKLAICHA